MPPQPSTDPRDAEIAALKQQLADSQQSETAKTTAAAPQSDHVDAATLATAEPGQIVRYRTNPANGDEVATGYALILDVVDVDEATGGEPVDGQPSASQVLVARLDVQANRLVADQVLELIG